MSEATIQSPYSARPWLDHYDFWVPPHMNYPRRPLHEILRMTAVAVPDRPATAFLGAQLTFSQIKEQADKLAGSLFRLGIRKTPPLALLLPNFPHHFFPTF